jgi:ABC-type transport system involved in multi-copper enzyme maturation permease subunit
VRIWVIAVNTLREALRDRILYNLLFFALAIMVLSVAMGKFTIGQRTKVVLDTGLAAMSVFGLLIAIFVGIQLVYKEIQRRTIYVLLAKPVARHQFLLGKFLGLGLTLLLNLAIMTLVLVAIYQMAEEAPLPPALLAGVGLTFVELLLITSVALLFSTFSTPMLSAMFTLAVYVIGHLSTDLKILGKASKSPLVEKVTTAVYYLVPNLSALNIRTEVVYRLPLDPAFLLTSALYGLVYVVFLLALASLVFQRRDFK